MKKGVATKMKRNKKYLFVAGTLLLAFFVFLAAIEIRNLISSASVHVKISTEYLDEQELLDKSQLVVVGKVTSGESAFMKADMDFQTFEFEVIECLNSKKEIKTLTILQTVMHGEAKGEEMFVPLKKGNTYILFLDKYEGGLNIGGYVINGISFGQIDLGKADVKSIKNASASKVNYLQSQYSSSTDSAIFSVEKLTNYYNQKEVGTNEEIHKDN